MPLSHRASLFINLAAACLALFIVGPIVWMAMDRAAAYTVKSVKVVGTTNLGDPLILEWRIVIDKEGCTGADQRIVTDSIGSVRAYEIYPDRVVSLPLGPHTTRTTVPLILSRQMALGPAFEMIRRTSSCNLIQQMFPVVKETTIPFTIGPADALTPPVTPP